MLLQNSKTMTAERGVLATDEPMTARVETNQTAHLFNNNHNLSAFDRLIKNEYVNHTPEYDTATELTKTSDAYEPVGVVYAELGSGFVVPL